MKKRKEMRKNLAFFFDHSARANNGSLGDANDNDSERDEKSITCTCKELCVKLNGSNLRSTGKLVPMRTAESRVPEINIQWPCIFNSRYAFSRSVDIYWFIFDEPQTLVNLIEM